MRGHTLFDSHPASPFLTEACPAACIFAIVQPIFLTKVQTLVSPSTTLVKLRNIWYSQLFLGYERRGRLMTWAAMNGHDVPSTAATHGRRRHWSPARACLAIPSARWQLRKRLELNGGDDASTAHCDSWSTANLTLERVLCRRLLHNRHANFG